MSAPATHPSTKKPQSYGRLTRQVCKRVSKCVLAQCILAIGSILLRIAYDTNVQSHIHRHPRLRRFYEFVRELCPAVRGESARQRERSPPSIRSQGARSRGLPQKDCRRATGMRVSCMYE